MINNYFLLYHSTNYVSGDNTLLLNFQDEDFDKISALILSLKTDKLTSFLELEEFKKLYKRIIINGFLDTSTLYEFCFIVLDRIKNKKELASNYLAVFDYLASKEIISKQDNQKLTTIFEHLNINIGHINKDENDFLANKEVIISILPKLETFFESKSLIDDLTKIQNYIQNQTFSIGITGIMNVGKSTFINALLSTELLGSSVIAETANLSVIKYADKAYTKVRFFNKSEFDEMLHTFSDENERINYLNKLQSSFILENYIQDSSRIIEIKRSDLHKYTSASDSSSLCHIVKDVELGVNLDFLKDSIEIVDTPGLDDTFIVRESVTQAYVAECDLLIHLMNVNQSATQKDVDFIIESILKQNVTKVLILLTKADNVSQEELKEVINYTKTSIENQLFSLANDSNVVKIIKSLKFLSISAKVALNIRKVNEQEKYKKQIQKSGILEVENYLYDTLFSKNSKNELIIKTASRRLYQAIKSQIKIYHYNLVLYSKDENALEDELKVFNETKERNQAIYTEIYNQISQEKYDFKDFIQSISLDMDNELSDLKTKLLSRLIDEITYTLKKDKLELKEFQLKMIIEKSLNHGFIDIVREHKYKLEQKVHNISKNIELSFQNYNIKVNEAEDRFSMQSLFEKNSSSVLSTSSKMILKVLINQTKAIKLSKLMSFKEIFSFKYVKVHLQRTIEDLNEVISLTLFETLREPILNLEVELKEYEDTLEKQIFLLKDKDEDIEQLKIDTQHKINSLEAIMESLS